VRDPVLAAQQQDQADPAHGRHAGQHPGQQVVGPLDRLVDLVARRLWVVAQQVGRGAWQYR
jgi:hypothetical protein